MIHPKNVADGIEAILAKYGRPDARWTASETWDDAYQLELQMINLLDPERLDVELETKIKHAKDLALPTGSQFDERHKAQTQTSEPTPAQVQSRIDRDRAMLQRLTEDLQWLHNTRD